MSGGDVTHPADLENTMTITAAIRTAVETQTLPAELADRVSNPEGCGGLDEWLHSSVISALDAMDAEEREEAIAALHYLATQN